MPRNPEHIPLKPSKLETIDMAIYEWVNDTMNLFSTTHNGWEKIPVIWVSPERTYQIKSKKELRDSSGALILPLITVERTSISKDPKRKGSFWGDPLPTSSRGMLTLTKKINQSKTAIFANADFARKHGPENTIGAANADRGSKLDVLYAGGVKPKAKKTVYEIWEVPLPVYVDMNYSINIRTQYQQQMNEILQPFITRPGGLNYFVATKDGYRYECFIQKDFAMENNVSAMEVEERLYKTKIDIKTLGKLVGDGPNNESPKITIRENVVEVKIPRERVILGDIPEHVGKKGFYRE